MITTIYQKYISRYDDVFTLVDMTDGADYIRGEIVPAGRVSLMSEQEFDELFNELLDSANLMAYWDSEDLD